MQELVARGRVLFKSAPKRLKIYTLVDGRNSTPKIARMTGCEITNTQNCLRLLKNADLVRPKSGSDGKIAKKENFVIYEKNPLATIIPLSYFSNPIHAQSALVQEEQHTRKDVKQQKEKVVNAIEIPSEGQLVSISKERESQIYEFKQAGAEIKKVTKGIAAFANTKRGGLIIYGFEDDGTISGSDLTRNKLSESIQRSVKDSIDPPLIVKVIEKDVLGHVIQLIRVPPRPRKTVYQYLPEERNLIRKDTVICVLRSVELNALHAGKSIV